MRGYRALEEAVSMLKKYGRMSSEEELKRVMSELYASEIIRRGIGSEGR
jgi:hypothetical protein